ncbi:hypothetical protein [Streptomyces tsukubensis]|uniref:Secreted protein n=1 Tax=Streptomyces tsukubensis TaxID=83656 RepID=A0A1V4A1Q6_9ACTN|nr:hypothetical protein [Streptomyces tsukubensis]OON72533.1 hypothetical protein B1H18_29545 [Streptomyces tsukubensis]QFR93658.1 hypothetical protein GBW32_11875 [Streptomyces tsukubensis]
MNRSGGGVRRRTVLGAALVAVSFLLALTGPGTTRAHASSLCAGHLVKIVAFGTGKVRVYRSGSYVCVVTYAKKPGHRVTMSVSVQARGSRAARDKGKYTKHAGPVRVHAGHRCIRVTGTVGKKSGRTGWFLC